MPEVTVKRVLIGNDHDDTKWLVIEGSIAGVPAVTKRRSINTAALVSGVLTLESEKAQLILDVLEYYDRHVALQEALKDLE